MEGHGEAAADVITGGVIGRAIEPDAGSAHARDAHGKCRNCGASLDGAYCSNCGQPAHLHRSLSSLGHDILHGVFHFEGKVWRTIPELLFHPGRLTRRYIDGERAKFVSPMALYLFTVFLMFAVFSFTSGNWLTLPQGVELSPAAQWKTNINDQMEEIDEKMAAVQERLADEEETLNEEQRAQLKKDIADLQSARDVMDAMVKGEWAKIAEIERDQEARKQAESVAEEQDKKRPNVNTMFPALDARLENVIKQASDNPQLLTYKLKTAGYKYSWALIPLSVPFMWLLFFWRRDVHLYDHAVFVTYSLCFMMVFLILLSVAATAGLSAAIWGPAIALMPLHLYKQLRGAYGLSRFGALLRLFLLSILISIVLVLFSLLLLMMGLLG